MNRNLKFAIGQFVVFTAGAGLCELVTMHLVMGIMLLAALISAHEIYKALPREVVASIPVTQGTAEDDSIVFTG